MFFHKSKTWFLPRAFLLSTVFSTVGFLWIWNLGRNFRHGEALYRTTPASMPTRKLALVGLFFSHPFEKKYQIGNNFGGPKFLLASENSNFKKHLKNPCSTTAMGLGLVSQNNSVGKSFHHMKKLGT